MLARLRFGIKYACRLRQLAAPKLLPADQRTLYSACAKFSYHSDFPPQYNPVSPSSRCKLHTTSAKVSSIEDNGSHQTKDDELIYEEFYEEDQEETETPEFQAPISLERGIKGVFDVDELVALLRSERGLDVCTIVVPADLHYVDYMVVVSGLSTRHILGMARMVKKYFKQKRRKSDPPTALIEGQDKSRDWLAMDLGNIVVHLFRHEARCHYDLESLWCCGVEYDSQLRENAVDMYSFEIEGLDLSDVDFEQEFKEMQIGVEDNGSASTHDVPR